MVVELSPPISRSVGEWAGRIIRAVDPGLNASGAVPGDRRGTAFRAIPAPDVERARKRLAFRPLQWRAREDSNS